MDNDIKTDPNNQPPQANQPRPNPPKTVDGISSPPARTNQNMDVQTKPDQPTNQPVSSQQNTEENHQPDAVAKKDNSNQQQPAPSKPKSQRNIWPIIAAVVILLALSSLAVYAGIINKEDSPDKSENNTSAGQPAQSQTTQDNQAVQETIQQIDGLPQDKDTSGDNLTDDKLGL